MEDEQKTREQLLREVHELRGKLVELQKRERQFRAIADYTPEWQNWVGSDGELLWVNSAVSQITGYSIAEILQMDDFPVAISLESDRKMVKQAFTEAIRGKFGNNVEFRIVCKNGRHKWVSVSWCPMYDEDGRNLGHRSSIRDITTQKRVEEKLRKAHQQLTLAQEIAGAGVWVWNIQTGEMDWSDELYRLFGLDPKRAAPSFDTWRRILHPKDRERAEQNIYAAIEKNTELHNDYRVILPSRQIRWIYAVGKVTCHQEGKPLTMVGICLNVTKRKETEEELTKHRENLESLVNQRTRELETTARRMEETITALKVLLDQREKDRDAMHDHIMANLRQLVMPFVEKLRAMVSRKEELLCLDALENTLMNLVSPFAHRLLYTNINFTPKELQVANLISEGKSSKEIADILNLSTRTVEFHRDNIRKRLGLKKTDTNLRSYLMTHT